MKVRTYVLVVSTAILTMSAATNTLRTSEGLNPGDQVPGIESLGKLEEFSFQNHSNRYTLLNFWAAYDGESRARNVQLSNEINKLNSDKIQFCSISMDEIESIFHETVRIDQLDRSTQFHDGMGKQSALYRKFKLQEGFKSFLVDENGVIIETDLTPEKLAKTLERI